MKFYKDQRNITGYNKLFTLLEQIGGWPMLNEYSMNSQTTTAPTDATTQAQQQKQQQQQKEGQGKEKSEWLNKENYSWENAYLTLAKKLNIFYFVGVDMIVDLLDTNKTIITVSSHSLTKPFQFFLLA